MVLWFLLVPSSNSDGGGDQSHPLSGDITKLKTDMKFRISNSSESNIAPLVTAGGDFPGLEAGGVIEVSEAVAKDLRERYGFLSIERIQEEAPVVEEAEEEDADKLLAEDPSEEAAPDVEDKPKETVVEKFQKAKKKVFGK